MTEDERYTFDLTGFLVIPGAISTADLTAMNAWIDGQARLETVWRGQQENRQVGNILTWGPRFRDLLTNPKVAPYLRSVLGDDYRLDHDYAIFLLPGHQGMRLHCGGTPYDPAQYYHCYDGRMYNGLTVAAYTLTDVPAGAGGFACIPGSHKSRFRCPEDVLLLKRTPEFVQQVPCRAGDCILFTEALTHGTLPWRGNHVRRTLYFKFSPGHMSWSSTAYFAPDGNRAVQEIAGEFTLEQRALLEPPGVEKRSGEY